MKKIILLAVVLTAAILGASAQNLSTSGTITASGSANSCTATSCVYFQLPSGSTWVTLQLSGTWSGSTKVYSITSATATYQSLNSQTWNQLAQESANGTFAVASGQATFLLIQASSLASGSIQVTMTSSSTGSPLQNPVLPGTITATGIQQNTGGAASTCWGTSGDVENCGFGPLNIPGSTGDVLYNSNQSLGAYSSVPIAQGGTGASTASAALANLGGFPISSLPVSIANGGTGATTASAALTNLGAPGTSGQLLYNSAGVIGAAAGITTSGTGSLSLTGGLSVGGALSASQIYTSYYAGSCTQASNRPSWCPVSTTDFGAIINAAIAAMPLVSGYPSGIVVLPAVNGGSWATTVTVNSPYVSIIGAGRSASSFTCTVNADCLFIETNPFTIVPAGRFEGFTVAGNNGSTQNGLHVANVIGASFRDLVFQGFGSGAALWMDNLQTGAWTERNSFVNCAFAYSLNAVLFSTESTSTNSFGYTRMLDVQLNTSGTERAIYVKGGGVGSVVYHGTYRFTLNADNTSGPEVEVDSPSAIQGSEFYMYAENQASGSYMYNVQSGASFYSVGQTQASGFGNNVTPGTFIEQSIGGASNEETISPSQSLIIAYGGRLNGIVNITLENSSTAETDSFLVSANAFDPNVTVTVLSHRCSNGACISSTGTPYIVEDASEYPQLVLALSAFTGTGTAWAQWYGVSNVDNVQVFPSVTLGTTTTGNNPNLASLLNAQNWVPTQTFSGGIGIGTDSTIHAGPRAFLQFATGQLAAVVTGGQYFAGSIVQNATIENFTATAAAFTCTTNPTLTLEDCGASAGACSSPTALASVTLTAANTITVGTVSSSTLTAGHYFTVETTAGTCTVLNATGSAEYKME